MKPQTYFDVISEPEKVKFLQGMRNLIAYINAKLNVFSKEVITAELHKDIDRANEEKSIAKASQCKKGCSFCCYLHVDITEAEALILSKHVTEEMKPILLKQSAFNLQTWKTLPYKDRKCVFLKDGVCSVYEYRPASCRKYFVVSNPKKCNTEHRIERVSNIACAETEIVASALFVRFGTVSFAKGILKSLQ